MSLSTSLPKRTIKTDDQPKRSISTRDTAYYAPTRASISRSRQTPTNTQSVQNQLQSDKIMQPPPTAYPNTSKKVGRTRSQSAGTSTHRRTTSTSSSSADVKKRTLRNQSSADNMSISNSTNTLHTLNTLGNMGSTHSNNNTQRIPVKSSTSTVPISSIPASTSSRHTKLTIDTNNTNNNILNNNVLQNNTFTNRKETNDNDDEALQKPDPPYVLRNRASRDSLHSSSNGSLSNYGYKRTINPAAGGGAATSSRSIDSPTSPSSPYNKRSTSNINTSSSSRLRDSTASSINSPKATASQRSSFVSPPSGLGAKTVSPTDNQRLRRMSHSSSTHDNHSSHTKTISVNKTPILQPNSSQRSSEDVSRSRRGSMAVEGLESAQASPSASPIVRAHQKIQLRDIPPVPPLPPSLSNTPSSPSLNSLNAESTPTQTRKQGFFSQKRYRGSFGGSRKTLDPLQLPPLNVHAIDIPKQITGSTSTTSLPRTPTHKSSSSFFATPMTAPRLAAQSDNTYEHQNGEGNIQRGKTIHNPLSVSPTKKSRYASGIPTPKANLTSSLISLPGSKKDEHRQHGSTSLQKSASMQPTKSSTGFIAGITRSLSKRAHRSEKRIQTPEPMPTFPSEYSKSMSTDSLSTPKIEVQSPSTPKKRLSMGWPGRKNNTNGLKASKIPSQPTLARPVVNKSSSFTPESVYSNNNAEAQASVTSLHRSSTEAGNRTASRSVLHKNRRISLRSSSSRSNLVDSDILQVDEEIRNVMSKRKGKTPDVEYEEWERLSRECSRSEPVNAATAVKVNIQLNLYEKGEIFDYQEIFFMGKRDIKKREGDLSAADTNYGYDDERGDYIITPGDHIAYRYGIVDILGKGSFGQVIRCMDYKTGELVAVKIIRNKKRFHAQAIVEVNLLKKIAEWDPEYKYNMVRVTDFLHFRGHLCIVTELLGMNLYEIIKYNDFKGFSVSIIRRFTQQMLQSLILLRKHRVIHCDLKPENILLAHPLKSGIKVIDFGSSCFEDERVYTYIQSRFYRSPEVILGMSYSMPIDMWSLGCILAELYTGYPLFPGENEQEQLACIMEIFGPPEKHLIEKSQRKKLFFDPFGKPRPVVSSKGKRRRPSSKSLQQAMKCDDGPFLDFIAACLRWNPSSRLTPEEAIIHPFIMGTRRKDNRGSQRLSSGSNRKSLFEFSNIPVPIRHNTDKDSPTLKNSLKNSSSSNGHSNNFSAFSFRNGIGGKRQLRAAESTPLKATG